MNNTLMSNIILAVESDNFYFHPDNRKWEPLVVSMKTPVDIIDKTVDYLFEIGVCDQSGQLSSLLINRGLFLCFTHPNDAPTDNITEPRIEYLVSPMGLQFLKLLSNHIFNDKQGITNPSFTFSKN